jgi:DNA polymerase theta
MLAFHYYFVFKVIPVYLSAQWPNMDWMNYLSLWESLSPDVKRVGELVGVEERFLVRAMRGTVNPQQPAQVCFRCIFNVKIVKKILHLHTIEIFVHHTVSNYFVACLRT